METTPRESVYLLFSISFDKPHFNKFDSVMI